MEAKDRIIVALDVSDLSEAGKLIEQLCPHVGCFNVGLELLTAHGAPAAVSLVKSIGGEVFFDGKFCDIPNTVGKASKAASAMGVKMFNVHASSGIESMRQAVANRGSSLVLAVTVLTSLGEQDCEDIFGDTNVIGKALTLASMAQEAGVDGIICSPREVSTLRAHDFMTDLYIVTPGVRPTWAAANDQKRVMTPSEAITAGADYLVIGRPITNPPAEIGSPIDAALRIAEEIEHASEAGR